MQRGHADPYLNENMAPIRPRLFMTVQCRNAFGATILVAPTALLCLIKIAPDRVLLISKLAKPLIKNLGAYSTFNSITSP
jgi:hypothetical protein